MRRVLFGDVVAAARVMMDLPFCERHALLETMLGEAQQADAHRRATGQMHPYYGDGSLMSVALMRRPRSEPWLSDNAYRESLMMVLGRIGSLSLVPVKIAAE